MHMRKLGHTDLSVSPLCLGGNVFGWTANESNSFAVLDTFMADGGNFIDTANSYAGGESENLIGSWMRTRKNRNNVIIATKVGNRTGLDPKAGSLTQRDIIKNIDASLKRLQTDYIDLYQAHFDDPNTPLEETLGTFDQLVRAGKVRYVGTSNYSAERLQEALQISKQYGYVRYESLQPHYNLVTRAQYEQELESVCLEHELGVITYFSLARGFLTGKYRPNQPLPASPRAQRIQQDYMNNNGFKVLEELDRIATAHHATVAQIALAWIMARSSITAAIASATTREQVHELLGACTIQLQEEEQQALDRASAWSRDQ